MPLTSSQLEAIQARGNVIVVAGAGTGKTSTLVERCVALLDEGCSIEGILMVTFTDAAAAEMRHRLRVRLAAAAAQAVGDAKRADWRQEQLALLDTARICTLHSFCLQLIREHFHLLGIDPAVKVLDEQQTRPLIEESLDACLEPHFAGADAESEAVRDVIRRYGLGDVERIRALVLALHRYAQSLAAPERWFVEQLAAFEEPEPKVWRAWFEAETLQWAATWLTELEAAAGDAENLARCARALRGILERLGVPGNPPLTPPRRGTSRDPRLPSSEGLGVGRPFPSWEGSGVGSVKEQDALAAMLAEISAADAAEWPKRQKTRLRQRFIKFFEEAEFLASQCGRAGDVDGLSADWENVRSGLRALLVLAREFSEKFAAAKREMGGIDFADLEQFALRLLLDGEGEPSLVALQWQTAIEHVFVDECQDINAAQDAILRAVSRGGCVNAGEPTPSPSQEGSGQMGNRFLVGDVKQSIYQFRLARPALFRGYEEAWKSGATGRRILLSENFRSAPEIIGFVNALFAPLMRNDVGGVEYESLLAGRVDGSGTGILPVHATPDRQDACPTTAESERRVEFHLIPKATAERDGGNEEEDAGEGAGVAAPEDLLAVEREARVVALRLRELHRSGLKIWDKEFRCERRVEWRDMAVLLRSPSNRVEAFAQEFHKCGVPLQAPRGGFFQSTEIMDLLSFLRLLDNPLQDIPLLAVLRSPLVALTLDELAEIRAHSGERRFWTAVRRFHREVQASMLDESWRKEPTPNPSQEGSFAKDASGLAPLLGGVGGGLASEAAASGEQNRCIATVRTAWAKVDLFLKQFAVWRELARQVSLSHCLERALTETDYEAVIKAGERGTERAANVRKFVETVRQYDPYQRQGLFRFLKFVDALEAAEQDIEPAPAQSQNAVRLMSIHQSKGLEFPVVAVACLGGLFNLGDLHRDVLLDEEFGLCAKAVAAETGARHPTLAHWLAARRQRRQILGEELRLLYVAATRARDRLLLIGTATKKDSEAWEAVAPRAFSNREILSARSPLDWLMLWVPTVTRTEDWQGEGGVGELLRWKVWADSRELELVGEGLAGAVPGAPMDGDVEDRAEDVAAVTRRIRWGYAHEAAAHEPAKTSVTVLRRKAAELADEDAEVWGGVAYSVFRQSRAAGALDAAEVGTLHHEFLRRMSLAGACDVTDLRTQLGRMVEQGAFNAGQAAALDMAAVAKFWQGEIGCEIRANANAVRRELPFTARFTPVELERITGAPSVPELSDEFVVVQGVADLVVMRDAELWLLDFKTDDVIARDLAEKTAKYRPQLELYAEALAAIYGKPLTRRWLHFLKLEKTVEV